MRMEIVLIAHNIRSTHNVGSLLRTADGLGVKTVYFTGYTPYPLHAADERLPHIANKLDKQIHKTALGAEKFQKWLYQEDILSLIQTLKSDGYTVCALEQSPNSVALPKFIAPNKIAIIIGREVEGLESAVLAAATIVLEIPMKGKKESFNVAQAAAMALYHVSFFGKSKS